MRPQLSRIAAATGHALGSDGFPVRLLGDPVLRERADEIQTFDASLQGFVKKMKKTLLDARVGIGLAAPQVGFSRRVVVYDDEYVGVYDGEYVDGSGSGVLINPEILEAGGKSIDGEACLSFPGEYFEISRPRWVRVRMQQPNGNSIEFQATGLLARLVQHEVDHLNGTLIVDHLPRSDKHKAISRYVERLQDHQLSADARTATMDQVDALFGLGISARRHRHK